MTSSDLREVLLPIIAVVIHPLITIGLFILYLRCVRPHFQKHPSPSPVSQPNNGSTNSTSRVMAEAERSLSISIILSPLLLDEVLPSYWKNRGNCVEKVDITDTVTEEFIRIIIHELWSPLQVGIGQDATPGGPAFIKITNIYRVENSQLFLKYNEKRRQMVTKKEKIKTDHFPSLEELSSSEISTTKIIKNNQRIRNSHLNDIIPGINEHFLFHGTIPDNVDSVWRNGLSTKFTKKPAYGKGVYMAEHPTKSDQYTGDPNGDKHMFLCRACLGEMFVFKKTPPTNKFETPPCRDPDCLTPNCKTHKYTFDSAVIDIGLRFREFIVFRDYRTYPEYLIKYKLVHEMSEA